MGTGLEGLGVCGFSHVLPLECVGISRRQRLATGSAAPYTGCVMESVGALVLGALSAGAVGVARMEIARLVQGAMTRLARRGWLGQELALVADALARSDEELAEEMERLEPEQRQAAAEQLDDALNYDGPDEAEQRATQALREQAEQLRPALTATVSASGNRGQVVYAAEQATVHAPFSVGRDYIAGQRFEPGRQG